MDISSNDILKNISNKNEIKNILSKEIVQTDVKFQVPISVDAKDKSLKILLNSLFKDLSLNLKTKDTVLKILQDKSVSKDIKETNSTLKSIIADLKNDKTLTKSTNILEKLVIDIKNLDAKSLQQQIKQSGLFLESKLSNLNTKQILLPKSIKETLYSLKNIIKNENVKIDVAYIDKVLNAKLADKNFIDNIKQIITNSKTNKNQSVVEIVAKLENLIQKNRVMESKISNEFEIKNSDIKSNIKKISTLLDKIEVLKPKIKEIIAQISQDISKIQNMLNLNKVEFLKLNISEKLQQVVNLIKNDLIMQEPKADVHVEISKLVQVFKEDIKITNKQILPNQQLQVLPNPKNEIIYDIKANLLQLKEDLAKTSSPNKTDTLNKVDKVLTSINYYQLSSYSSGTNILYLPVLWEGLDEGQISIKRLKKKKFFCEINLKLKEYGKIDLLVMLFDEININISIFTRSDIFLKRVKKNLKALKQGINSIGLIPTSIYMYDSLKDDKIKRDTKSYVDSEQIGEGINIHV